MAGVISMFRRKTDDSKSNPLKSWRRFESEEFSTLREKIEGYTPPPICKDPKARILMIGKVGAGKSSFFNTINSIFSDKMTHRSPCGSAAKSFTKVHRQYHIRSKNNDLKFCMCDMSGIGDERGPLIEDIKYLLDGNIPDGYEFNASQPINPNIRGFKTRPGLEDLVHCVAFVVDASTVEVLDNAEWEQLKNVQEEVAKREIPRVILLTKVDKLCKAADIYKVVESSQIIAAVNTVSATLGIPQHNVHPIKNYETEIHTNDKTNRLALIALDQMITLANDFLRDKFESLSKIKPWREQTTPLDKENMLALMKKIRNYAPPSDLGIPFARILMIGPKGSGKSSFFNTINSVFSGRITQQSIPGGTKEYQQHQIQTSMTETALKFRLCDTRGIKNTPSSYLTDIMFVINGNVPDRYKFNSSAPIAPGSIGFKNNPGLKDKVHCVVFVVDASTIDTIPESISQNLNELQLQTNNIGVPRAVLLTKIDKISKTLHDDVSIVFRSENVDLVVEKVAKLLDVPKNIIFPVKNYEEETCLNDKISTLSLLALDQILGFADDFLSKQRNTTNEEDFSMWFLFAALVILVALANIFPTLLGI